MLEPIHLKQHDIGIIYCLAPCCLCGCKMGRLRGRIRKNEPEGSVPECGCQWHNSMSGIMRHSSFGIVQQPSQRVLASQIEHISCESPPSTWASKLKLGPKVKRCLLFWPVIRIFNFTFLYYLQFLLFRNTLWNFQMNCHYVGLFIKKRLIGNRTPWLPFALILPNVFSWVHKAFAVSIVSSAKKVC